MAEKKKKPIKSVRTPLATAAFAWIHKPDTGKEYSDNKYKVTLVFDADEDLNDLRAAAEWVAKETFPDIPFDEIAMPFKDGDEIADAAKKKGKDKEEFRGKVLLISKTKEKPKVVDSKRKPLPKGVECRSGDLIKAVIAASGYKTTDTVIDKKTKKKETIDSYGVNFYLNAVQLIEKRNMGAGGADMFDDEDGFEGEDQDSSANEPDDDDDDL